VAFCFMGLGVRILLERSEGEMPTTTDYVSSVSLLPTVEFLELVAKKQWDSTVSYGLGISTIVPMFHSTTNSEWLCLNTEAEFLNSPIGTVSIKNPFAYTRPESSPVYVGYNDISIPSTKANKAKSLYLFRIDEDGINEVITVSNYDKKDRNVTTAPPLDCFSRECMTWFSSDVDWFTGFGVSSQSLASFVVNDNGIILSKSSDILAGVIPESVTTVDYTNIQVVNTVSTFTPWVSIQLSTGVQYMGSEDDKANILFLFSVDKDDDSLVAFAHGYTAPAKAFTGYNGIETRVYFDKDEIIII
jgi:hypothetical protein